MITFYILYALILMIKILKFQPSSTYTDVEYVDGIVNGSTKVTQHFFEYCKKYFEKNYRAVFFVQEEDAKDIFQNTCIALFQNIERKKSTLKKVY